jgi:D-3-phosphoglycerate dehydrogenase
VLGTRYPDLSIEEGILEPLGAQIVAGDGASSDAIVEQAADADVILAGSGPCFDAFTLERLRARAIVRYGVGTESIDLPAASARGMWVAYVPDYGTEAVAVHAVTLALAGARRLIAADRSVRNRGWGFSEIRPLHLPSAMTAGVVGLGRIGRRVAEMFGVIGFSVRAHDPFLGEFPDSIAAVSLREALACDVVSLHAPGRTDGTPLIGAEEIASMSPGSVLINTSRGSLIDTDALIEGLRSGAPAVAALDVFATEPPDVQVFAEVADRMIYSPHMAWYSEESEIDLRTKAAHEAARLLQGEEPVNPIVRPQESSP